MSFDHLKNSTLRKQRRNILAVVRFIVGSSADSEAVSRGSCSITRIKLYTRRCIWHRREAIVLSRYFYGEMQYAPEFFLLR